MKSSLTVAGWLSVKLNTVPTGGRRLWFEIWADPPGSRQRGCDCLRSPTTGGGGEGTVDAGVAAGVVDVGLVAGAVAGVLGAAVTVIACDPVVEVSIAVPDGCPF